MDRDELDGLMDWLMKKAKVPVERPLAIEIDRVRRMVRDAYYEGKRMARGEREIKRKRRKAKEQEQVQRRAGVAEDV